jgi:hypothetical protein
MYYFQSLFFIIIQKKMQPRRKFIFLAITLNSSIICSVDNGMFRYMFINTRDCSNVFLKYVFKRIRLEINPWGVYPLSSLRTSKHSAAPDTCFMGHSVPVVRNLAAVEFAVRKHRAAGHYFAPTQMDSNRFRTLRRPAEYEPRRH